MNTCDLLYLNPLAFFNYNFQVNGKEIQYFGSIQRGNKKRLSEYVFSNLFFKFSEMFYLFQPYTKTINKHFI